MAIKGTVLTFVERKNIKKLIGEGYNLSEIAREIDRGKNTVIAEVRRNGGPLFYDPVKAEERAQALKQERAERCRELNKKQLSNPYSEIKDRIQNIEMQVEILVDAIKELRREC